MWRSAKVFKRKNWLLGFSFICGKCTAKLVISRERGQKFCHNCGSWLDWNRK